MNKLIPLVLALGVATQSHAFDSSNRAIVTGAIAGAVIAGTMHQPRGNIGYSVTIGVPGVTVQMGNMPHVIYQAPVVILPPVYMPPQHVIIPSRGTGTCLQHPFYDAHGIFRGFQISCH